MQALLFPKPDSVLKQCVDNCLSDLDCLNFPDLNSVNTYLNYWLENEGSKLQIKQISLNDVGRLIATYK